MISTAWEENVPDSRSWSRDAAQMPHPRGERTNGHTHSCVWVKLSGTGSAPGEDRCNSNICPGGDGGFLKHRKRGLIP